MHCSRGGASGAATLYQKDTKRIKNTQNLTPLPAAMCLKPSNATASAMFVGSSSRLYKLNQICDAPGGIAAMACSPEGLLATSCHRGTLSLVPSASKGPAAKHPPMYLLPPHPNIGNITELHQQAHAEAAR